MSSIPTKTGIPEVIDSNLATSIDFHIAFTNYTSITKSYINFVSLAKYYDSIKYKADPITAETDFWEGLATASLDLQLFAKNPKASKYIKKIEINIPPGDSLQVDNQGNPILSIVNNQVVTITTRGHEIRTTKDITADIEEQTSQISTAFDLANEDNSGEFVAWWLDKYRKAHHEVKKLLNERLNVEDTILQTISESVGLLYDQYNFPQSRYTHYADEEVDPTPSPYNSIIDNKLEFDTRQNILGLSKRAEAIFKRNMQQVIRYGSVATDAHRDNLVTDHFHYKRLGEVHADVMIEIGRILGDSYKLLYWLSANKIANKQTTAPGVFEVIVENSIEEVDYLMNKIQDYERSFTTNSLRATV